MLPRELEASLAGTGVVLARVAHPAACDELEAGTHTPADSVELYCFKAATDEVTSEWRGGWLGLGKGTWRIGTQLTGASQLAPHSQCAATPPHTPLACSPQPPDGDQRAAQSAAQPATSISIPATTAFALSSTTAVSLPATASVSLSSTAAISLPATAALPFASATSFAPTSLTAAQPSA